MQKKKERVVLLSIVSNIALILMKIFVGFITNSVSIISEAIHSGIDLLAAIIAFFSVKISDIPADEKHPFGHGKIENISGLIEALLIFLAAIWIIFEAIKKIKHVEKIEIIEWGVVVMLVSSIVNFFVSQTLFKVGKETDSMAIKADAWHLRTDVYTSLGIMLSLLGIWLGNLFFPNFKINFRYFNLDFYFDINLIDPISAICVALIISKAAYDLTKEALDDILDSRLPIEEKIWIKEQILSFKKSINGFHNLRTRKSGKFRFIDFHIKVNPEMSVQKSHDITEKISDLIQTKFPDSNITVHVEPCIGGNYDTKISSISHNIGIKKTYCYPNCINGCFLPKKFQKISK